MNWVEQSITAVVTFLATWFGVNLAFRKELRRADRTEREQFGDMLHGVRVESASNHAILANLERDLRPDASPAFVFRTDALKTALASPLMYQRAPYSLILAADHVSSGLGLLGNLLGVALGRGFTARGVAEMRIRVAAMRDIIRVMQ